ncbi:hypothetical protein Pint_09033 [Pistacia integerrima]|uniref:Uncharacterized protein n=1 Tax=Pistacia integerrima TaxID=434235 RepID=A0ACC0XZK8_9ROSI|nr:hypothetical protein Pint_09033 [Pistacia integerrima]
MWITWKEGGEWGFTFGCGIAISPRGCCVIWRLFSTFNLVIGEIVAEFTASWCPPCRFIAPIVNEMAKKLPGVIFLKSVAEDWDVKAMPTFVLLKESRFLERILGANKREELNMNPIMMLDLVMDVMFLNFFQ